VTKSSGDMPEKDELALAIKEIRRAGSLTQARLAREVGLAPTSIYRYEAGSRPDTAALFALTRYAEQKGLTAARNVFLKALGQTSFISGSYSNSTSARDTVTDVSIMLANAVAELSRNEKIEAFAFLSFLKENTDSTTERVIKFLLQPWRDEAYKRFSLAADRGEDGSPT
jgi:transcriptional regulator with XRE-family HTH domain